MKHVKVIDTLAPTINAVNFEANDLEKLALVCHATNEQQTKV